MGYAINIKIACRRGKYVENSKNTVELLEEAQEIEAWLVERRVEVFNKAKQNYPSIKYKDYKGLFSGFKYKKLPDALLKDLEADIKEINSLKKKALSFRDERDKIIDNFKNDPIPVNNLNPKTDIIPKDTYPKLKESCPYPLRGACDSGQNSTSVWARCEFMQYDNSKSPFSSERWRCIY